MPYALRKSGRGYYVVNKETGRRFSSKPLPKNRAAAQMRALYAVEHGYVLDRTRSNGRSTRKRRSNGKRSTRRSKSRSRK
jgi:hypothetical protein